MRECHNHKEKAIYIAECGNKNDFMQIVENRKLKCRSSLTYQKKTNKRKQKSKKKSKNK